MRLQVAHAVAVDRPAEPDPRRNLIGRAIRTGRYRMVEWKVPGAPERSAEYELYDYEVDKLEKKNIAQDNPDVLSMMKAILARHPEALAEGRDKAKGR